MDNAINNNPMETLKFCGYTVIKTCLYFIITILVIMYCLFCIYFGNVLHNLSTNEDRPSLFNAFIIVSPSMVPSIKINDGIVIKREKFNKLKQGDVITFETHDSRYDGLIVTHRIVDKVNNYAFRTKGDANSIEDNYLVKEKDIQGKVIFMLPKVGFIREIFNKHLGWVIFMVIPALFIIIYDIYKLLEHSVNKNKKVEEELEII